MKEFVITSKNVDQRLDKYLNSLLPNAGISFIYKMLRKKNFTLNDKKAKGSEKLALGDVIKIYFTDETFEKFYGSEDKDTLFKSFEHLDTDKLNVIYEDKDKIIVKKPFGMLSQKAESSDLSINELIISYLIKNGLSKEDFLNYKPSVMNRLDRNTGGLIIAAKNRNSAVKLTSDIKNKNIRRIYNVIVHGKYQSEDEIVSGYYTRDSHSNLAKITSDKRDNADLVSTRFKLLSFKNDLSLVECELLTGKSHQIRAMMKMCGFPVLGDKKYGILELDKKYPLKLPGQYLFAKEIRFPDGLTVNTDLPAEFNIFKD